MDSAFEHKALNLIRTSSQKLLKLCIVHHALFSMEFLYHQRWNNSLFLKIRRQKNQTID